jgi:hypothetical protein
VGHGSSRRALVLNPVKKKKRNSGKSKMEVPPLPRILKTLHVKNNMTKF